MPDDATPGAGLRFLATSVEIEGREETRIVEVPSFEPEPWGTDAQLDIVGQCVPRVDGREKVTGRATYTADVYRPGMLHAVLVRATVPRGRATIDGSAALAMSGVVDVITAADLPRAIRVRGVALFGPEVVFAGQPLAAVCGESPAAAWRGARAVRMTCVEAPFAVTYADATAAGAPAVRPGSGRTGAERHGEPPNLTRSSPHVDERGDVEGGLREAEVVLERTYRTPAALHSALEPHGTVAEWEGERLTLWESTQGIFLTREQVAEALGLPLSSVRVIKDYMGGGFGAKNNAGAHTFAAALLARRTGRPVRCLDEREGEQTATGHRPASTIRVTLGATGDGRLTAIRADAEVPLGSGGWEAPTTQVFHQLYACPNVRTTERFAYINGQPSAAFRAPGQVEGTFALERAMDELARALALDPVALRRRNLPERDQAKDRPYSSFRLGECLDIVVREAGFGTTGRTPESRLPYPESRVVRGTGVALQTWGTGGGPPAYAIVKLNGDGTADVLTGTQDLGTGARTILGQIAAEALGAPFADVRVILGDTERTPYAGNSWGSMTTPSVGPAVRMAAEDAKRQLLEAAAAMLDVTPENLAAHHGVVRTADGSREISFREIGNRLGDVMIIGRGSRGPNPPGTAFVTTGAQLAEVEVDIETGIVRVLRIVAVHDAGRIINPLLAESQAEGGILQGLGFALFEERILDRRLGLQLNPTLHDYKVPTMADRPVIETVFLPGADPVANHTGARGLAEPPIIPTAPAIANAVTHALGVEVRELPLTPWRVLQALRHSPTPD